MAIYKRIPNGAPLTAEQMDANLTILEETSGSFTALMTGPFLAVSASISNLSTLQGTLSGQFTGSALISGSNASLKIDTTILSNDTSTKRVLVHNPTTGEVGWNTVGGVAQDGTNGTSGTSGVDGTFFGTNGTNGSSGTSGVNGTSGENGTSGVDGTNGVSGTGGTSGTSGTSGSSGTSGTSGTSADSNLTNRLMQATASLNTFTGSIRGEVSGLEAYTASLKNTALISGAAQITALGFSTSGGAGGDSFPYTGSAIITGSLQLTGSAFIRGGVNASGIVSGAAGLATAGPLTASLREGYVWVGGSTNQNNVQIATSSLGGGGGSISVVRGVNTYTGVSTLTYSSNFSVTNLGGGNVSLDVVGGGGGGTGTNGTSGTSGFPGTSGTSGLGTSGTSGVDGTGNPGTSGSSGTSAIGSSGTSGSPGVSGTSGSSGTSGGSNGSAGSSGTSGTTVQLGVRDGNGGITSVFGVTDISFSGSVILTPSGSTGVVVTLTGGNGNSFSSASYNGWLTGSQQLIEAGFAQTASVSFKDLRVTSSMVREWGVTANGNDGYVFNAQNDPTLEEGEDIELWAYVGDTLRFTVNATSHPFYLKTSPTTGTNNTISSGVTNNGATVGTVIWNTAGALPTTYYYISSNNANLTGTITLLPQGRRTDIERGRLVHTGSMWVDGGVVVSGSIYLTGSIYQNGVPFVGGGGGGPFAQTGSYYSANGDVFVTGSFRVSGSITASAITVTSPGTPEIYSATNINLNAGNAVVITSSSLRLAQFSDGQTGSLTPTNGDMFYNSTTNKFMGRISGSWIEFASGSSVGSGGAGASGTSGTSGLLSLTGTTLNGVIAYDGTSGGLVSAGLKFEPIASKTEVTASLHITAFMNIAPSNPLPTGILVTAGTFAVSASGATYKPYFYDGSTWNALY